MQEQPPSDPPRREPATGARRSRSTSPTFTPPPVPVPEAPAPPAGSAEAEGGTPQRTRRARVTPTVLFQPPDPAAVAPRPADHDQTRNVPPDLETEGTPAKKATTARKTTSVTRATPAKKRAVAAGPEPLAPQVTPTMSGSRTAGGPELGRTPGAGWRTVAARLLDHPGFAPELLAIAAVDTLGPVAGGWVERTRRAYPDADADGLARLATRRFVRLAGAGGAAAAGAGLLAPVAELAAVLWTQASLVLHLTAVYGRDPGHPDRVAELLLLTRVHPDLGSARVAVEAARLAGAPAGGPWPRAAEAAWRLAMPLAAQAGGWLGLRAVSRLLPGAAVLAAVTGNSAAAERLAARAVAFHRPTRLR
ncbi:hypothetical protein ABZ671_30220 [Micromonospora sp. NPDC006766]|uniref:hypothetical protein n=1 Tax=Micromonospora sp. NPDC006766 TaxID=3154778 RepID=UPI0033ED659F